MTIKIVGFLASTYTLAIVATLKELGLPYEIEEITKLEDIKTPEFLANKNPFGKVPVLFDDDFKIYESRAIARYLINKYQGTKTSTVLIPSDVQKAALVEQFISVETSYYSTSLGKLVYQEIFKKFLGGTPDPEVVKECIEEINKVLDVYEKLLEGKDYLAGEFSLADILHCAYTTYAINGGHGDLWNKRPNVARWWKNISERECWKEVVSQYYKKK